MAESRAVAVAVCSSREPVAGCLEALREQVPPERVVVVGSGGAPGDLTEPRTGLSHARNRALAWAAAGGAEVLAFVDDDAVADRGWYEALSRRWD